MAKLAGRRVASAVDIHGEKGPLEPVQRWHFDGNRITVLLEKLSAAEQEFVRAGQPEPSDNNNP